MRGRRPSASANSSASARAFWNAGIGLALGRIHAGDRSTHRLIPAEHLLQGRRDFAQVWREPGRRQRQLEQIALAACRRRCERCQCPSTAAWSRVLRTSASRRICDSRTARLSTSQHVEGLFVIQPVLVHSDDHVAAESILRLPARGGFLDPHLRQPGLDRLGHAAERSRSPGCAARPSCISSCVSDST